MLAVIPQSKGGKAFEQPAKVKRFSSEKYANWQAYLKVWNKIQRFKIILHVQNSKFQEKNRYMTIKKKKKRIKGICFVLELALKHSCEEKSKLTTLRFQSY